MSAIQERLNKMEIFFDQEEFVVIDSGTGYIKAGFSGEDLPRVCIPTIIGEQVVQQEQNAQTMKGSNESKPKISNVYGTKAFESQATHQPYYPIQRGIIEDEAHLEKLWEHIFVDDLGLDLRSVNVLMTDSPQSSKEQKVKIAEIMFEKFRVRSFALMNTSVLSLFSTGRTSGLVVECGEGISWTVPVFEGYALPHAIHMLDVAGQDITNMLIKELEDMGVNPTEHFHEVRAMKEQMCHVAYDYQQEMQSRDDPLTQEQRSYELPDGRIIEVSQQKRLKAAEVIFTPSLIKDRMPKPWTEKFHDYGLTKIACDSIEKCDADLKINLYNNIVLAGGTTLMHGFYERFEQEIHMEADEKAKTEINVNAALHRKNAAWIGGSMLASFSTFSDMTIKYGDYTETNENDRHNCVLKNTVY